MSDGNKHGYEYARVFDTNRQAGYLSYLTAGVAAGIFSVLAYQAGANLAGYKTSKEVPLALSGIGVAAGLSCVFARRIQNEAATALETMREVAGQVRIQRTYQELLEEPDEPDEQHTPEEPPLARPRYLGYDVLPKGYIQVLGDPDLARRLVEWITRHDQQVIVVSPAWVHGEYENASVIVGAAKLPESAPRPTLDMDEILSGYPCTVEQFNEAFVRDIHFKLAQKLRGVYYDVYTVIYELPGQTIPQPSATSKVGIRVFILGETPVIPDETIRVGAATLAVKDNLSDIEQAAQLNAETPMTIGNKLARYPRSEPREQP